MLQKNLAIITARANSKRIPGKNTKNFLGRPIIHYVIEAAIGSQLFTEVMVSTDCKKIAKVALSAGAKVPFIRSSENSNDHSSTANVILEVIAYYKETGSHFDNICCLYPTAALLSSTTMKKSYEQFLLSRADTLVPVCLYSHPIQRAFRIKNQTLKPSNPEYTQTRTQDLEEHYHDVGMFYWGTEKYLSKSGNFFSENSSPYILQENEAQDIDNPDDWELAELKYAILFHK
jgi:pseudaminic acid cytidylyltransferase